MTKEEKLKSLQTAMQKSTRDDGSEFYHFSDTAPSELVNLFHEHYEIVDVDYDTFDTACNIIVDIYNDDTEEENVEEEITERAHDSASVYTLTRLGYINLGNHEEISENVRAPEVDIATACGYWYDNQVEQAGMIINNWLNA